MDECEKKLADVICGLIRLCEDDIKRKPLYQDMITNLTDVQWSIKNAKDTIISCRADITDKPSDGRN